MSQVNPKGLLMNCLTCGRDTRAKSGVCFRCYGKGGHKAGHEDQRGRPARSTQVIGGSPIEDRDDDDDSDSRYHGSRVN